MSLKDQLHKLLQESDHQLMASQPEVSMPIIERMYKKMQKGVTFADIRTAENVVTNGHHRYLAARLLGVYIGSQDSELVAAKVVRTWDSVMIVDVDFDKPEEIDRHNAYDAKCMDMKLEQFLELIG